MLFRSPSEEEYQTARTSLDRAGWEVDYVITHCCPSSVQDVFSDGLFQRDKLTDFLDEVRQRCRFQAWFFGHYHADMDIDEQFKMLYKNCKTGHVNNRHENPSSPIKGAGVL